MTNEPLDELKQEQSAMSDDAIPKATEAVPTRICLVTFLITMVIVAAAICLLGWFTNLRMVAHSATIGAGVFLGLPFAIMLFGIALALAVAAILTVGMIFGGGGSGGEDAIAEPFVRLGSLLIRPYYRMLSRIRHPMIWGFVFGVLSGGVLLCCLLWFIIIPGETETVQILADVREKITDIHKQTGKFPKPDANGHLTNADLGLSTTGVVLDGFGRPLDYRVTGMKLLAKVKLRSFGYDGLKGRDDLCISQQTNLRKWVDAVKLERTTDGRRRLSIKIAFTSIQDMQCKD